MNEQQARAVLLVKAIETAPSGGTFLSEAQRDLATAAALSAAPRPASDARRRDWTEAFIARRAERLQQDALAHQPRLQALLAGGPLMVLWRVGLPLLGLLAGLLAEFWVSPGAIDLLSPALCLFLGWNLLVFAGLAVAAVSGLLRGPASVSWVGATLARLAWPSRWSQGLLGISRQFQRDWMRLAGPATAARLVATLHLAAALCALGMVGALLFKGFFTEFRVGWQSQWLDARQMHLLLSTVGQWVGAAPFSLEDMLRLERGVAATKADGSLWAGWWSRLLLLGVALPRLVLAGLSVWRARRHARRLHLDLSDPYFVRLLAEHGGPGTCVLVLPYSLSPTPAQQQGLAAAVRASFGASATLRLLPGTAYGDAPAPLPAPERDRPQQPVALFSLAATPERETHGAFVQQLQRQVPGGLAVWLDSSGLSAHLADGVRGARLAEREALWRDFLGAYAVNVRVCHLEPVHDAA